MFKRTATRVPAGSTKGAACTGAETAEAAGIMDGEAAVGVEEDVEDETVSERGPDPHPVARNSKAIVDPANRRRFIVLSLVAITLPIAA